MREATSSAQRARRLLTLLPYLGRQGTLPLTELAAVTGTDLATLTADLTTLSLCGPDAAYPDEMISVFVDGDSAVVFGPLPALEEPVRLTGAEATALLAALSACGVAADAPLARRLDSVADAAADPDAIARSVRASVPAEAVAHALARLEGMAAECEAARISYTSAGAVAPAERVVWPLRCVHARGAWYLAAWDPAADGGRTFRLDRIGQVSGTSQHFTVPEGVDGGVGLDFAALPRAEVRFPADGPDLTDREWPGATFERQADGSVVASVPYAGTSWIARQVAGRLGHAVVTAPPEVRAAVAALAARERTAY